MKEPIRVLNITRVFQAAGIESFIMNMYRNIDRNKVQFDFLVMKDEKSCYDDEIDSLGGKRYHIDVKPKNTFIRIINESIELYKFLKKNKYQIIHVHYTTPLRAPYLLAAKKAGVPVRIYHSHSAYVPDKGKMKMKIYNFLKCKITKWATACFACSESAAEWMFEENVIKGNAGRIYYKIINNAIDTRSYCFNKEIRERIRAEKGIKENGLIIGHVGRMTEQKNALFALDVFGYVKKEIPTAVLWLIGDGELWEEIEKKIKYMGMKNEAVMLGSINNVNEMMQAMDVFLFPSLYEGLGIVLIEAQAAGMKVFTSDVMPLETNITSNIKYISLDKSAKAWAQEIVNSVYKRDFKRSNMSEDIIKAGYDINKNVKWLEQYYIDAVNRS